MPTVSVHSMLDSCEVATTSYVIELEDGQEIYYTVQNTESNRTYVLIDYTDLQIDETEAVIRAHANLVNEPEFFWKPKGTWQNNK